MVSGVVPPFKHGKRNHKTLYLAALLVSITLSSFLTADLGHGFLHEHLIEYVMVSIRKLGTNPSLSDIYQIIALSLTIGKILEWCLLIRYSVHLSSSDLQFGLKNMSLLCALVF